MSPEPVVSFVMPARQPRRDWLEAAVTSVLSQEDCDVELLVVDDGSPEPVERVLEGIDDPRLRVLRVDHGGISHARNAGIAEATGEHFRFIDADDVLEPGSTARLVRLAGEEPGGAIAYGATLNCDEELRPLNAMRSDLEGWIVEDCLLYRFDVRCLSMVFPRRVVEAVGAWDPTLRQCQDWDFVLRACEHAPVRGEPAIATFYRRHGGAQTSNLAASLDYERLVVDRYFERHPEQVGTRLERRARAQLLRVRATAYGTLGKGRSAQLQALRQAFALDRSGTTAHLLRGTARAGRRALSRARRAAVAGARR